MPKTSKRTTVKTVVTLELDAEELLVALIMAGYLPEMTEHNQVRIFVRKTWLMHEEKEIDKDFPLVVEYRTTDHTQD